MNKKSLIEALNDFDDEDEITLYVPSGHKKKGIDYGIAVDIEYATYDCNYGPLIVGKGVAVEKEQIAENKRFFKKITKGGRRQ